MSHPSNNLNFSIESKLVYCTQSNEPLRAADVGVSSSDDVVSGREQCTHIDLCRINTSAGLSRTHIADIDETEDRRCRTNNGHIEECVRAMIDAQFPHGGYVNIRLNVGLTMSVEASINSTRVDVDTTNLIPQHEWYVTLNPRMKGRQYNTTKLANMWLRPPISYSVSEIAGIIKYDGWLVNRKTLVSIRGRFPVLMTFLSRFQDEDAMAMKARAENASGLIPVHHSEASSYFNGYVKCVHLWELKWFRGLLVVEWELTCDALLIYTRL
jgi:hypothetical protein